jgi:UDP-glucose 4-epimerase
MSRTDPILNVLVAGGAGYIGSVVTATLIESGSRVAILDNLSHGHIEAVHTDARFVVGDIANPRAVREACEGGIDVVMHFAGFIEVGESVADPAKYYGNNVAHSIRFFDNLRECGVSRLVFSSTAAVYGEPESVPLAEDAPLRPLNPYGWSKRMIEQVLADYDRAYGFRSAALRYFNAGGAFGPYGEDHRPESHLIPRILDSAMRGGAFDVYGCDYPTRDGSCIRDYIHVRDLAEAHILAAHYLMKGGAADCFNLGSGRGFTVFEVIEAAERILGRQVSKAIGPRRPGDSPALVASPEKAARILGWSGARAGIDEIVASAYEWKASHPHGYGSER